MLFLRSVSPDRGNLNSFIKWKLSASIHKFDDELIIERIILFTFFNVLYNLNKN